ncbi:MAG: site-specific integrase [Nitrososphaerota archaeon]|nr:site-specific integrase [Nitrososphaerota archaeon]
MVEGQRRRTSKYAHLLEEDPAFRAWLANVVRGSHNTGAHYFLRMGFLCDEVYHIPPSGIAAMNRVELMTFVSNVISELEERGAVGSTINSYVKAVKSWARFNGTKLDEKVNVPESENMYAGEVVPRPEEVQTLLDHAPLRVKVAVSLMAFAGLRPGTIGDSRGTDGLKVKDLPEMEVRDGRVAFSKIPTLITVRKKISKIRKPYDTFAPAQACEYIRQYLEDRMLAGEAVTPETAVVTVSEFNARTPRGGAASGLVTGAAAF